MLNINTRATGRRARMRRNVSMPLTSGSDVLNDHIRRKLTIQQQRLIGAGRLCDYDHASSTLEQTAISLTHYGKGLRPATGSTADWLCAG
jgi:hypothetical protein